MRLALALRRLMVRTARWRPAWQAWRWAMTLTAWIAARYLTAQTGTTVWLRGSFGRGEAVPGLSDIDLVAVTADDELGRALTHIRRGRMRDSRIGLGRLVSVDLYEPRGPEEAAAVTDLRFGLEGGGDPRARASRLRSRAPADELGLRVRPPLPAPWDGWRRLAGRGALGAVPEATGAERLTVAWLELQYWWRHATRAATAPASDLRAYMTVKLAAESARVRLWAAGERWPATRAEALERLAALGAEEEEVAHEALVIEHDLPAAGRRALEPGLRALLLGSHDVARRLARAAGDGTAVELTGRVERGLPLADWNARTVPELPDEFFVPVPGRPDEPRALAAAGRERLGVVRAGEVLIQAGAAAGTLRGAQTPVTDPVSAALLDSGDEAVFPSLPGWSARDCALRAVAEHRSWLAAQPARLYANDRALGLLFTAARAALFLRSLDSGRPALALTAAATAQALSDADAALSELEACSGGTRAPDRGVLDSFRARVEALPPYAEAA